MIEANGTKLTNVFANGKEMQRVYANGVLVFQKILVIPVDNHTPIDTDAFGPHISIKALVAKYRKYEESEIIVKILNKATVPKIVMDQAINQGITKITLENNGIIQGSIPSGAALFVHNFTHLHLNNLGRIWGAGGKGGKGGKGGQGGQGANSSKSTNHTETHDFWGWPNKAKINYGYLEGYDGWVCDKAFWNGKEGTQHCTGKTGKIPGIDGDFGPGANKLHHFKITSGPWKGHIINVYDVVRTWTTKTDYVGGVGGEGGEGGDGGGGSFFKHKTTPRHNGHPGHEGLDSTPTGGNPGSKGGQGGRGGNGGGWGLPGHKGQNGTKGENGGKAGAPGIPGGKAGFSIVGINNCTIVNLGQLKGDKKNTHIQTTPTS